MLQATCVTLLIISLVAAVICVCLVILLPNRNDCKPTITCASGSAVLPICSGYLIFVDNFESLDKEIWQPEVTLHGDANEGFEWYVADDENSYEKDGNLVIKPTLTANKIGHYNIENGYVQLNNCTDSDEKNCERQAGGDIIINPIRSARLNTEKSFSFKYGRVEIIAKLSNGDWLWPGVRLLPSQREWPKSSGIDLLEARGNRNYSDENGVQIGVQQVTSGLHFERHQISNRSQSTVFSTNNATDYSAEFHKYTFIWNENGIRFFVDDVETGFISASDESSEIDQEFHFVIDLAVGGTSSFFPNTESQRNSKPWNNTSPTAMKDFWLNRHQWIPTWHFDNDESSFLIESVKVWAI